MKINETTSVVLTIIFVIVLFGAFLINERDTEILQAELNELQQQKEELEIESEEKLVIPIIDCKTNMIEGDIRAGIAIELYNPLGEWVRITEKNASYQLQHGGRVVECLEEGGDEK